MFPVVDVRINGILCRALIDSGAGSSYASAKLIHALNVKPVEVQTKQIEMLLCTKQVRLESYSYSYQLEIESTNNDFKMETNLIKVNKSELLSLDNPRYEELIHKYSTCGQFERMVGLVKTSLYKTISKGCLNAMVDYKRNLPLEDSRQIIVGRFRGNFRLGKSAQDEYKQYFPINTHHVLNISKTFFYSCQSFIISVRHTYLK